MRRLFLLVVLLLARESTFAQPDTVIFDTGVLVKAFLSSQIDSITFAAPATPAKAEGQSNIKTAQFDISQNYPNPFNPTTRLNCFIPSHGKVLVQIFDITGRLVKVLFAGEKEKGNHIFLWDGKNAGGMDATSGIYLFSVWFNEDLLT